jgi:hypothetical protein
MLLLVNTPHLLNKKNLVRHLKAHLNNDSSIIVNKGQSLERARFFFPIKIVTNLALASGLQGLRHVKLGA